MHMESTGFRLQPQEEFAHQFSTSSPNKSDYKPSFYQAWNQTRTFNGLPNRYLIESITNSRELEPKCSVIDSQVRTSQSQDFGFYGGKSFTQQLLATDALDVNLPKLSDMLNSPSRAVNEFHPLSQPQEYSHSFLAGRHVTAKDLLPAEVLYSVQHPLDEGINVLSKTRRCNFGSVSSSSSNLSSTLDLPTSLVSCSLGLNSQMLDLHTSYGSGIRNELPYDAFRLNEESICLSHGNMQGRENSPSNNKISAFMKGAARPKRPGNCSRHKESSDAKVKKPRTSCPPPLKVRKEKLGDRIQALQRLVAPFGKTDTASVLTEAIGYIHFLQDQIQTLSVPYMKSTQSQSKPFRMLKLDPKEEDGKEMNRDLRSRGLCLVPLSYASCVNCYI
ncbi:hypothetical protein L6164_020089 [Bauhinia variegata]|uniref:Uncharacterized protein n=1 Tax=Bauhinia variegata TaxID=167791 RepID=A0ACB9MUB3_BAUVA|nr:hypothetical protein L6164_020089 [Bauhinia variegata]